MSDKVLEEGAELRLDWDKIGKISRTSERGVVPAVAQDAETGRVLIIGYADETALRTTMETGTAVFWSTSRNELWIKGATSGDYLDIREIRVNCEQNSLLYLVTPRKSGACHTRDASGESRKSCFYRILEGDRLEFAEGEK